MRPRASVWRSSARNPSACSWPSRARNRSPSSEHHMSFPWSHRRATAPTSERIRQSSQPLSSALTLRWRLWTVYLEAKGLEIAERLAVEHAGTPGDPEGGFDVRTVPSTAEHADVRAAVGDPGADRGIPPRHGGGAPTPGSLLDAAQPGPDPGTLGDRDAAG